ncbi:MAG TPA: DUF4170 domain-containing protein [Pelagibacterium sp.]|uniref:DUF4170 domain-containing protein n=1 Tax=Pelagibacterium sp. TaxID=1967288 RepID=UPI002CE7F047|nr:DUF4170 domain-containing protein [Pelagibacterium sp.]HWJ89184.1 DUF4170 domain-containing protein [Pelagibacterium sp.]
MNKIPENQLLHLVIGGELSELEGVEFRNLDDVDIVGVYPNYASAYEVWKQKAQMTVDNAEMRYFIVHLHKLLDPSLTA